MQSEIDMSKYFDLNIYTILLKKEEVPTYELSDLLELKIS